MIAGGSAPTVTVTSKPKARVRPPTPAPVVRSARMPWKLRPAMRPALHTLDLPPPGA